ncbi:MAG: BolA protein [Cellvibrionaceae bacterium]|jgi:BolA protein
MNMQQQIEQKLIKAFDPVHLEVIDESQEHKMPRGSQTNFRAVVVSECFVGKSKAERHTKVYRALLEELDGLIKTFTVLTYDTRQWQGKECSLPLVSIYGGNYTRV